MLKNAEQGKRSLSQCIRPQTRHNFGSLDFVILRFNEGTRQNLLGLAKGDKCRFKGGEVKKSNFLVLLYLQPSVVDLK